MQHERDFAPQRFVEELRQERAHPVREIDEAAGEFRVGAFERRRVHRSTGRTAAQNPNDVARKFERNAFQRFERGAAKMRRRDHVRMRQEPLRCRILRRRFLRHDVDCGAAQMSRIQRSDQRLGVDDAAARAVDEHRARAHRGEPAGVDETHGLRGKRNVQRHDVGVAQQFVQALERDVEGAGARGRDIRIVRDHVHAERFGAMRDVTPDAPKADDAERLPIQLVPDERLAIPEPGLHGRVRARDVAHGRQEQREGLLRRGDRVRAGRVHHDDARSRCGVHVDRVHADPGPRHDFEMRGLRQKSGVHARLRAHDEAPRVAEHLDEPFARRADAGDDLDARPAQNVETALVKGFRDDNAA